MGIRELAEFSLVRTRGGLGGQGRWRSESGRQWHNVLQEEVTLTHFTERKLVASIRREGWQIDLEGRIDLIRYDGETGQPLEVGEIKTVTESLPLDAEYLREQYPAYFRQAAAYARFLQEEFALSQCIPSFLLFVDIDSGLRQQIEIRSHDHEDLKRQIEAVVHFLEQMRLRYRERREIRFSSMMDHPRPGQIEVAAALEKALREVPFIGLQAPTGFGKTRLLWETALRYMETGKVDRILYGTVKNSGQEQAIKEWGRLFPNGSGPVLYRMRNHPEHHAICPVTDCQLRTCSVDKGMDRITSVEESLYHLTSGASDPGESGDFAEDRVWDGLSRLAQSEHFCPYDLSRSVLPLADVWVADINYLFSPGSRHLFWDQPGFQPERTLLLLDEAHNLPDRVESALTISLQGEDLVHCSEELRQLRVSPPLRRILRDLAKLCQLSEIGAVLGPTEKYQLIDCLEVAIPLLDSEKIPWRELSDWSRDLLQSLDPLLQLMEDDTLQPVLWLPAGDILEVVPLNTTTWTRKILSQFYRSVFFSATLEPMTDFSQQVGVANEEWRPISYHDSETDNFRVAIDATVDTRLKHREKFFGITAQTAARMKGTTNQPLVVFFPSRKYAEAVRLYLEVDFPHLRVGLQPTATNRDQVDQFLQSAIYQFDIILLLLGGVYAEGIDSFGGIIDTALIVGPGLPELNPLTRAKMEACGGGEAGFEKVCRIPGMRRVNQAMGRLVRNPNHQATILLQDRRFGEEPFRKLLRNDLGEVPVLSKEVEVDQWLAACRA